MLDSARNVVYEVMDFLEECPAVKVVSDDITFPQTTDKVCSLPHDTALLFTSDFISR
jgi:hypothetical protein